MSHTKKKIVRASWSNVSLYFLIVAGEYWVTPPGFFETVEHKTLWVFALKMSDSYRVLGLLPSLCMSHEVADFVHF